jgi:hypothetical protein
MNTIDAFLRGDRHDDVALYLSDSVLDTGSSLYEIGDSRGEGVLVVVPGEKGRSAFQAGTGMEAMEFAGTAMDRTGDIAATLDAGSCPDAGTETVNGHAVEFIFAFTEPENPEVGGLYADGDVLHAYAHCSCGASYSHKWVIGDRSETASDGLN